MTTEFTLEIHLRDAEEDETFDLHSSDTPKSLTLPATYVEPFADRVAFYGEKGHDQIELVGGDWKYDGQVYDFLAVYPKEAAL